MTLPVYPNTIKASDINTELIRTSTGYLNLDNADVRTLAGKTGAGTRIAYSDLSGKSYTAIHTLYFKTSQQFQVPSTIVGDLEMLVVAGGGSGGWGWGGGGGGGGGVVYNPSVPAASNEVWSVNIGSGGAAAVTPTPIQASTTLRSSPAYVDGNGNWVIDMYNTALTNGTGSPTGVQYPPAGQGTAVKQISVYGGGAGGGSGQAGAPGGSGGGAGIGNSSPGSVLAPIVTGVGSNWSTFGSAGAPFAGYWFDNQAMSGGGGGAGGSPSGYTAPVNGSNGTYPGGAARTLMNLVSVSGGGGGGGYKSLWGGPFPGSGSPGGNTAPSGRSGYLSGNRDIGVTAYTSAYPGAANTGDGGGGAQGGEVIYGAFSGTRAAQGGSGLVIVKGRWALLTVEYLIVGGGGGSYATFLGGGGGAGGYVSGTKTLDPGEYVITIGAGGSGASNGGNSSAFGITAYGGGKGANAGTFSSAAGSAGGSGGGAAGGYSTVDASGGQATAGQGNIGGPVINWNGSILAGAGGGGADATGNAAFNSSTPTGVGGNGLVWLNGVTYAGGGGGAWWGDDKGTNSTVGAAGGLGGGGQGGGQTTAATSGILTTGGGGGGAVNGGSSNGGGGRVIIRYPGYPKATGGSVVTTGGYTYHYFNTTDSFYA